MIRITSHIIIFSLALSCSDDTSFSSSSGLSNRTRSSNDALIAQPKKEPVNKLPQFVEQTFTSSKINEARINLQGQVMESAFDFTLRSENKITVENFKQHTRTQKTDIFEQGKPQEVITDNFEANVKSGPLDIIVVVDNSGSMKKEQEKLAPNLKALVSAVSETSWQIALVSTDADVNNDPVFIRKSDNEDIEVLSERFEQAIKDLGTKGSGWERGLVMAKRALSYDSSNWLQADSNIAVLIVADEDNCGSDKEDEECRKMYPDEKPPLLKNALEAVRPTEKIKVFAIVEPDHGICQGARPGFHYVESVRSTGGEHFSLCEKNYEPILTSISESISEDISNTFSLSSIPFSGSLDKILVNGETVTDYSVNGKTLTFNQELSANAKITVTYSTTESTMKTRFSLREKPASDSVRVFIGGEETNNFVVNASEVMFNTIPAAGSNIEVIYKKDNVKLERIFSLNYEPHSEVEVFVNEILTPASVDVTNKTLAFDTPPSDGSEIRVSYQYKVRDISAYKIFQNNGDYRLDRITEKNKPNKQLSGFIFLTDGTVVLRDTNQFLDGRELTLHMISSVTDTYTEVLPNMPLDDSFEVLDSSCLKDEKVIELDGRNLSLICQLFDGFFSAKYLYETEKKDRFTLDSIPSEASVFEVRLNGELTTNFDVTENVLTINEELEPETQVTFKEMKSI